MSHRRTIASQLDGRTAQLHRLEYVAEEDAGGPIDLSDCELCHPACENLGRALIQPGATEADVSVLIVHRESSRWKLRTDRSNIVIAPQKRKAPTTRLSRYAVPEHDNGRRPAHGR